MSGCCGDCFNSCPTGPTGPIGPTGPTGTIAPAFAYISRTAADQAINAGNENVIFDTVGPISNIVFNGTDTLTVQQNGVYSISYYVQETTQMGSADLTFLLGGNAGGADTLVSTTDEVGIGEAGTTVIKNLFAGNTIRLIITSLGTLTSTNTPGLRANLAVVKIA